MPLRHVELLQANPAPPDLSDDIERLRGALAAQGIRVVSTEGDGLIALPGAVEGLGAVLARLEDNDTPCGLLDTSGYYSKLFRDASDSEMDRLVRERQRGRVVVDRDPAALVRSLAEYQPPETRRQSGASA